MLAQCWAIWRFWLAYVGPDIPIFVGNEWEGFGAPQIWCLTVLMLAIMESRLRLSGSMLGVCLAYVGPMLGYADGWVGLCWARYSHICGAQMSRFWCPTNSVSDSALYELPPAKPIKMFCAQQFMYPKSL